MENGTPQYAKWIPEANGYVYNGNIVSQTPLYDNTGRTRIEVGMNEIQTPQTSTVQAPTKQAPSVMADVGQSFNIGGQSNQAGSGTDMNAAATAIGSMAALNTNTARSNTGTLGSPALQSNIANVEPLDPREKVLKDYEYMVATNNLQGQINALTELQTIDGVDYSAQIQDLQQQRAQKIKTQDDTYSNLISYYSSIGRDDLANQYVAERNAYRNKVGYQDMITQEYNQERQTIQDDFVFAYQTGLNDINNAILASIGELVNFQYDPTTDRALHVAQGYAVGQVKEQMNHTGMYYSSMTQNAITRAIAELVPVYEKMARDEIKENISMMMNIGNYLMNLEQDQFNMWKTRIQLKYQENEDRRAEIQQAWQRANYLGYIDNEASTILGIPAGTLSPNARQQMIELQQEKDKEERSLDIQKRLADYQQDLAIEKMQEEERLNEKYWSYQVNNPKPTSTGSGGSGGSGTRTRIVRNADGTISVVEETTLNRPLTDEEIANINATNQQIRGEGYHGTKKGDELAKELATTSNVTNADKVNMLLKIKDEALSRDEADKAVGALKQGDKDIFDKKIFNTAGIEGLIQYYKAIDKNYGSTPIEGGGTILDAYKQQYGDVVTNNNVGLISILADSTIANKENMISGYITEVVKPKVDSVSFGGNAGKTKDTQEELLDVLGDYTIPLLTPSFYKGENNDYAADIYELVVDKIYSTPNYDISKWPFNQGEKGQKQGVEQMITYLRDNTFKNLTGTASTQVIDKIKEYEKDKK